MRTDAGPGLTAALAADADDFTWVAAAMGSNNAAGYQLAAGAPVMAIGGFNGTDPAPTLTEFQRYVADKQIHYFIRGRMMIGQLGRRQPSGSREAADIADWVETHYRADDRRPRHRLRPDPAAEELIARA